MCYLQGKLSALKISIIPVFLDKQFGGRKLIGIGTRGLVFNLSYVFVWDDLEWGNTLRIYTKPLLGAALKLGYIICCPADLSTRSGAK